MKQFLGKIKVPASIKLVAGRERITPELEVGKGYYVCYGNNNVYRCRLSGIINEFAKTEVSILLPLKAQPSKIHWWGWKVAIFGTLRIDCSCR